mmetsp:Transcript_86688/g.269467  ORF Transcript_86688/g.269467 Transcript_86688/m.269467 type:complete len:257 (-) Transcript_86688:31-801(-)
MPAPWRSNSPFPTGSSFGAVKRDAVQRCYYQTAYQRGVPGSMPAEEDRGENFMDLHSVGQRTSKYMDYQLKTAPLLNRNACASTAFSAKPLGDCHANRMLAENFKQGTNSAPKGLNVTLDGHSEYEACFRKRGQEDLERARQKGASQGASVFARTKTLGGSGNSLEKTSHTQLNFTPPNLTVAKPLKVLLPRQCLDLGGQPRPAGTRTTHQRSFAAGSGLAAARMSASAPDLGDLRAQMPDPPPSAGGGVLAAPWQ